MVQSKAIPAATSHSDWYMFLRSAFIDGLKAYGAALMVGAPAPEVPTNCLCSWGGDPSHWGTGQNSTDGTKPAIRKPPAVVSQTTLALSHSPLAKPAWSRA